MPTIEEIVEAVWSTVINGATAKRILEAFFDYIQGLPQTGSGGPDDEEDLERWRESQLKAAARFAPVADVIKRISGSVALGETTVPEPPTQGSSAFLTEDEEMLLLVLLSD